MSRIEEALEKAAKKRVNTAPSPRDVRPVRPIALTEPVLPRRLAAEDVIHDNPLLVMINDAASPVAEEYRKLKAVVAQMTKGGEFRNTILVTSAIPNEGKSITALNLAVCLAQELDHTVLLVDADLRRPSIHQYLGVENGPGLAQCLTGETELSATIMPTAVEKLSIIRAGTDVGNPVELFSSQRMRDVLDELKHRYHDRYIIFDSPPVLPFAEARSLAQLVDGVLLVAKEQYTPIANIQEAVASLSGCQMLGIVYNEAEINRYDDRYAYYRGYSYNGTERAGNRTPTSN